MRPPDGYNISRVRRKENVPSRLPSESTFSSRYACRSDVISMF